MVLYRQLQKLQTISAIILSSPKQTPIFKRNTSQSQQDFSGRASKSTNFQRHNHIESKQSPNFQHNISHKHGLIRTPMIQDQTARNVHSGLGSVPSAR